MRTDVTISADDLAKLLEHAMPMTISVKVADAVHSLALSDLSETRLVADRGLKIVCKGRVSWPVLGVKVPLALNSVSMLLLPEIARSPDGDALTFRLAIEHADFSGIPEMIDNRITEAINAKLAEKDVALSWGFGKALTYLARLPSFLDPLEAFVMRPAISEIRITEAAVSYGVTFHTGVTRRGEPLPGWFAPRDDAP
jgi:hypothetical protein